MFVKRIFDLLISGLALILLIPLFFLLALLIKMDSPGPVFFRQERVGFKQKIFRIHKFRTMILNSESKGLQITIGADNRITSVGNWLRKYKLDELPQLIDVFIGNMSLVGPRPEVPYYVAYYPDYFKEKIFSVKPGITEWASIEYREENIILNNSDNPQRAYIEEILPIKLEYSDRYVRERGFFGDILIIIATVRAIFLGVNSSCYA